MPHPRPLALTGASRRPHLPSLGPSLVAALATALAACADPATAPDRLPAAGPGLAKTPAASCTAVPIRALTVTPTALTLAPGESATVTACTQYASSYSLTSSDPALATVPATVVPVSAGPDQPFVATATVSVPASAPGGATATITLVDKKGSRQTVTVTVADPPPPPATFAHTGQVATYTVPLTGVYTLAATGAAGGGVTSARVAAQPGGVGATAQGQFILFKGTVLTVAVGGPGGDAVAGVVSTGCTAFTCAGAGGGGGSFVVVAAATDGPPVALVVGGGGGGAANLSGASGAGRPGNTAADGAGTGGSSIQGSGGAGGAGGLGGAAGYLDHYGGGGGGGGGLFGRGGDGTGVDGGGGRGGESYPAFTGGAAQTASGAAAGAGGFGGGGGGSSSSAGGGGGYGGGGGGGGWLAGGGGSYVNASPLADANVLFVLNSDSRTLATTRGPGSVTITWAGPL